MAKFSIKLDMVIDGDDVDDAITKAAIHFAMNASAKRPILTVQPQNPYEFPAPREYDLLGMVQKQLFKNGDKIQVNKLDIMPIEAWPEPPRMM